MIRLAFLGVLLIAGLLTFGAFFLARGAPTNASSATTDTQPITAAIPDEPEAIDVQRHYALRDIDLENGEVTLVLFPVDTEQPVRVIRDTGILSAARETVYFANPINIAPSPDALASVQVYRDDVLVDTVMCGDAPCRLIAGEDGAASTLLDAAIPIELIRDRFDVYQDYLATIDAILADPNFMLLDARPEGSFPRRERTSSVLIDLATIIMPTDATFDVAIYRALLSETIGSVLPENTTLTTTSIFPLDPIVLGDRDNNQPILSQGVPIVFDAVQMHSVQVLIEGTATLDDDTLAALDAATRQQIDFASAFDSFIATRIQSACADCLIPLLDERFVDAAQVNLSTPAVYDLVYYDLREAP